MNIFRIKVYLASGRYAYTGLFASACEALEQTRADWPEACRVSAICLSRKGGVA